MADLDGISFVSTEGHPDRVDITVAIRNGIAPDGGVYMPTEWPNIRFADLADCSTLAATAKRILPPFFAGTSLQDALPAIIDESLDLPLPLLDFELGRSWILELFHGPTGSFKDFSARFLAACMSRMRLPEQPRQAVILASTGDSGCALAAAFHHRPDFHVIVLYPAGTLPPSDVQQLGAFGDNIHVFGVDGDFDDCQRLMDIALQDETLWDRLGLSPANSVSVGRLLPQMSYYAHGVVQLYRRTSTPVDVIVPTGNLDNALACLMVRQLGLPIGDIVLATDANHTSWHHFPREMFQERPGLATLAKAMDVGDPSSFDRLAWLFRDRDIRNSCIKAYSVSHSSIARTITDCDQQNDIVIGPETACSIDVLRKRRTHGHFRPHLIAAITHPAKHRDELEPLLKRDIAWPPELAELMTRVNRARPLANDFDELRAFLLALPPADLALDSAQPR